jgi:large subunit ribosomal protein L22
MTPPAPKDPKKDKDEAAPAEEKPKRTRAKKADADAPAEKAAAKPRASRAKKTDDAAAEEKPKPKRAPAKKKAEPEAAGQAAAETGVDKTAAEAVGEGAAAAGDERSEAEKPKRPRKRVPAEDKNPEGTKPEGTKEPAAAAATEGDVKEAAKAQPRKRDRRRRPEPGVLVRAQAKYVRTSARKARLVCDHIRGKDVVEARAILAFTPRAAAKPWLKLLESAVANAEHNHELVGDELRIAAVHADEGPTLKRYRPRAMGRATRIRKRTSHLTITLTPKES